MATPPVQGLGADPNRLAAATAAYGKELGRALAKDAEVFELLDDEPTRPIELGSMPPAAASAPASSPSERASLEPVSEDAHPAEHRRAPTQPELLSEALAAVAARPTPAPPLVLESRPVMAANRSPSPVPVRMGLFSADRITNVLAGAAVGLLIMIVPAQKLARSYTQELMLQPLLELNDSIDAPIAVDAGLLRKPQAIAAEIQASREAVQTRFLLVWLLAGLPIGVGLGFIPRWWA